MNETKYPIYIVSKNRPQCLTARALDVMGGCFRIVIEPCDFEKYEKKWGANRLLVLPFANLGLGSIPARNWIWEHSAAHARHWILDDNIEAFNRLNRNQKPVVKTMAIFRAAEDFTDRFVNVGLSGFNYYSFCKATDKLPPFYLNTRIYSCILVNNSLPFRWRGRYNEDTDLSLRVLKSGLCTILFNCFLAGKITTMRMKGGNTDELYQNDGRRLMAESLAEQHPDVTRVSYKFGRWQHHVNYRAFRRNSLIMKPNLTFNNKINEYGMKLVLDDSSILKHDNKLNTFPR